jgi:hypothetical protein
MIVSEQPRTVTLVACPPPETDNGGLDQTFHFLSSKGLLSHRICRIASVRDIDVVLSEILAPPFKGTIRLQVIGHSIPGSMCLGARWTETGIHDAGVSNFPFPVLDTNPRALGLLAKFAGKLSEVMLVGCHVGSSTSFGHAINGRTLTYTLAELLRCKVLGADDDVAYDEYDEQGWYAPAEQHRRPKGWRWNDAMPPAWSDPGTDPLPRNRRAVGQAFDIHTITSTMLPLVAFQEVVALAAPVRVTCQTATMDKPESGLPELSVETDQGPGQILCGGRILKVAGVCYVMDRTAQLTSAFATMLRTAEVARGGGIELANAG